MASVLPFGDRRADIRSAIHTANLIASQSTKELTSEDFAGLVASLSRYLKCDEPQDELQFDPEALERVKNGGHR